MAIRLNNLAQLLQATNRLAEAEPLMRRALAIDEQSYGPDHPNVAIRLNNLARAASGHEPPRRGRAADAPRARDRRRELRPGSSQCGDRLNNLAQLLQDTNRLAEAEPLMRRALAIDEKSYGPDHPNVAIRPQQSRALLQDTNRLAEAEPLMRRALAILETSLGPDHPSTVTVRNNLAALEAALAQRRRVSAGSSTGLILRSPRSGRLEG